MRKLRRHKTAADRPARAAVVVPNGTLSSPGVAKRIRSDLLDDFNLFAIVRLPHNVFAPYTDLKTNILFFQRGQATEEILFCEPNLPVEYSLSKTKPLLYEWLEPIKAIIAAPKETDESWIVRRDALDENLNLDLKNPRRKLADLENEGDIGMLGQQFRAFAEQAEAIRAKAEQAIDAIKAAPHQQLGQHTTESDERVGTEYTPDTLLIGVSADEGMTTPKTDIGKNPSRYKIVRHGYLAYNPMRVNIGSIGVARNNSQIGITSPDYVVFFCKQTLLPEFVYHYLKSEAGRHEINQKTKGSVRFRLYCEQLAQIKIPVPVDIQDQQKFVDACNQLESLRRNVAAATNSVQSCLNGLTRSAMIGDDASGYSGLAV